MLVCSSPCLLCMRVSTLALFFGKNIIPIYFIYFVHSLHLIFLFPSQLSGRIFALNNGINVNRFLFFLLYSVYNDHTYLVYVYFLSLLLLTYSVIYSFIAYVLCINRLHSHFVIYVTTIFFLLTSACVTSPS